MIRKYLNVRHAMNMVIVPLSILKEKRSLREDLDLEVLEIDCILMRKKKNLIKVEVKMNGIHSYKGG